MTSDDELLSLYVMLSQSEGHADPLTDKSGHMFSGLDWSSDHNWSLMPTILISSQRRGTWYNPVKILY